jgi:hypothetical protein
VLMDLFVALNKQTCVLCVAVTGKGNVIKMCVNRVKVNRALE